MDVVLDDALTFPNVRMCVFLYNRVSQMWWILSHLFYTKTKKCLRIGGSVLAGIGRLEEDDPVSAQGLFV